MALAYRDILGLVSVALAAVGYGSYITTLLRRQTKPHLFSWSIWAVMMILVFYIQLMKGAGAGAWVTGFSGAACLVIALLSLKHGEKNFTLSDKISFAGALLIMPIWHLTHDPLWAVLLATAIDALAYYPTFRKSWGKPFEENFLTYSLDVVKWVIAFFAFNDMSATTLIYPLFCFSANTALVLMILARRAQAADARDNQR
jgi:hypothetical protein